MKPLLPFVLLLIIFVLLCLLAFYTINQTPDNGEDLVRAENNLMLVNLQLSEANAKIVGLQENERYVVEQLRKARLDLNVLQEVYSNLFEDAGACYWANACLYRPENCEANHEELGGSAQEWHEYYSEACNGMLRDWKKYQSYDVEFGK